MSVVCLECGSVGSGGSHRSRGGRLAEVLAGREEPPLGHSSLGLAAWQEDAGGVCLVLCSYVALFVHSSLPLIGIPHHLPGHNLNRWFWGWLKLGWFWSAQSPTLSQERMHITPDTWLKFQIP